MRNKICSGERLIADRTLLIAKNEVLYKVGKAEVVPLNVVNINDHIDKHLVIWMMN